MWNNNSGYCRAPGPVEAITSGNPHCSLGAGLVAQYRGGTNPDREHPQQILFPYCAVKYFALLLSNGHGLAVFLALPLRILLFLLPDEPDGDGELFRGLWEAGFFLPPLPLTLPRGCIAQTL